MRFFNQFSSKFFHLALFGLCLIGFTNNTLASRLSEEWINLDDLFGEERRLTQSLISKRKHFNNLVDSQRYEDALEYSKGILENPCHTLEDESVFKKTKKGLQSITAMRQNFHSKVKEKEYDYARHYLTDKILTHSYHNENDKYLTKFVTNKSSKRRNRKAKKNNDDSDVRTLISLMKKNCYIRENSQEEDKKKTGFSKQFPFESSGYNYLYYINDLLPDQR